MTRKKRQLLTILLLVIVSVGLCAGYIFLSESNKKKEAQKEEEEDTSVVLYQIDKEQVATLYFKNQSAEVNLVKKENTWVQEGQETVPMNQENIDKMLTALEEVKANRLVTQEAEDVTEYGLSEPSIKIRVTMKDNKEYILYLGIKAPSENGYYASTGDNTAVYILPFTLYNNFEYKASDMIAIQDGLTAEVANMTRVKLEREGKDTFEAKNVLAEDNWVASYYEWSILKPYKKEVPADTTNLKEYLGNLTALTFKTCVEYESKDVSVYGLDKPQAVLNLEYNITADNTKTGEETTDKKEVTENKTYGLKFGDKNEEGDYYVQPEGSHAVYLLAAATAQALLEIDIFNVSDQCVYLGLVTDMSGYEFTVNGHTNMVERKEVQETNEEGTEETVSTYYVNGQLVDSTEFVNIFSATYLLEVSGIADDAVIPEDNTPVLSLDYHMLTGEDVKIEFIPYDGVNFYRVNKNGIDYFLTDKRGVDDIVRRYTEFVKNME